MISKISKVPLSLFLFFSTLNFQLVKRQVTSEAFFLFAWFSGICLFVGFFVVLGRVFGCHPWLGTRDLCCGAQGLHCCLPGLSLQHMA